MGRPFLKGSGFSAASVNLPDSSVSVFEETHSPMLQMFSFVDDGQMLESRQRRHRFR
jgi:hypothetical protein